MINLGAFYDGNGRDRYEEVYNLRISIKGKLKKYDRNSKIWFETNIVQEGYKLILNSASGILDGSFDTNLRANNKSLSMRIIGQLFTWRIAQALAIEGATVPSSNTDGIYVSNIDIKKNTEIVNRELEKLYVKIDPEPLYLVSKDTNNRMESENNKIISAKGGSLSAWEGPLIEKRLDHPAFVDKVLTYYLQNDNILNGPVNRKLIQDSISKYLNDASKRDVVFMSSWLMRSTSGSIFIDTKNNIYPGTVRSWLTKDGVGLSRFVSKTSRKSKTFDNYATFLFDNARIGDPNVIEYLSNIPKIDNETILDKYFSNCLFVNQYKQLANNQKFYSVSKMKVSKLPDNARLYFNNNSLLKMTDDEINEIYSQLDFEAYTDMIMPFAENWHNILAPS